MRGKLSSLAEMNSLFSTNMATRNLVVEGLIGAISLRCLVAEFSPLRLACLSFVSQCFDLIYRLGISQEKAGNSILFMLSKILLADLM